MKDSSADGLHHPAPMGSSVASCGTTPSRPGPPSGTALDLAPMRRALDEVTARRSGTLEEILGRSLSRLWYRSLQRGFLTPFAADKLAIRACNVHPSHIWADEWFDAS